MALQIEAKIIFFLKKKPIGAKLSTRTIRRIFEMMAISRPEISGIVLLLLLARCRWCGVVRTGSESQRAIAASTINVGERGRERARG
jgi:transcription initiation factor TFIIIB Brf1 subunit/transcription initiation factor TFIIB